MDADPNVEVVTSESSTGESIFRAMEDDSGMPRIGANATTLGIRNGKDIVVDANNMVHRPMFFPKHPNGLSCAPTLLTLPIFALPVRWGGTNPKTEVWRIELTDLGSELVAQEDSAPAHSRHISIGPAFSMPFDQFVRAIAATQPKWRTVV
jgi:hypothetical protein